MAMKTGLLFHVDVKTLSPVGCRGSMEEKPDDSQDRKISVFWQAVLSTCAEGGGHMQLYPFLADCGDIGPHAWPEEPFQGRGTWGKGSDAAGDLAFPYAVRMGRSGSLAAIGVGHADGHEMAGGRHAVLDFGRYPKAETGKEDGCRQPPFSARRKGLCFRSYNRRSGVFLSRSGYSLCGEALGSERVLPQNAAARLSRRSGEIPQNHGNRRGNGAPGACSRFGQGNRAVRLVLSLSGGDRGLPGAEIRFRGRGQKEPQFLSPRPRPRQTQAGTLREERNFPRRSPHENRSPKLPAGGARGPTFQSRSRETGVQPSWRRIVVDRDGHRSCSLECKNSIDALFAALGNRSLFQNVEAVFGTGRLPIFKVPGRGALPAARADRLSPADPSGSTGAGCPSRTKIIKLASTAKPSSLAATTTFIPVASDNSASGPQPAKLPFRPKNYGIFSAVILKSFTV